MTSSPNPFEEPFGSLFGQWVTAATYTNENYTYSGKPQELETLSLHPGSHVLHYGSTCFEGLKAHKQPDGTISIFRIDDHVQRMQQSIKQLHTIPPEQKLLKQLILDAVQANLKSTPENPGSLYIRPVFLGNSPNIGAAAAPTKEALLYVMTSPVGDYFKGGIRPLSLYLEKDFPRTTPQFGMIKSGANYALALGPTMRAKENYQADQVLFATNNDITETGAANFFLIDDNTLITRNLDTSFLHGITRTSVIQIAKDAGYEIQERKITTEELLSWEGESFLSGTAAVIAPVGKIIDKDHNVHMFKNGSPGENTLKLRDILISIQQGKIEDSHGWRTTVAI